MKIKKRINKWINKKVHGNTTSLILGIMFLLLLSLWALFNYRMYLLNAAFEEIDDDLSASLLAGSLVNIDDYSEREQLVIHNDDVYDKVTTTGGGLYNGWTKTEADILVSEINYNSEILISYDQLPAKECLNINARNIRSGDEYLNRSIQSAYSALYGNLCGGGSSSISANADSPAFSISLDDLQKGPIGFMLGTGIEVTRFDIYNIYTVNMARKHKYLSRFFEVDNSGVPHWLQTEIFGIKYDIDASTFPTFTQFMTDLKAGKETFKGFNNMTEDEILNYVQDQGLVIESVEELEDNTIFEEIYNRIKHRYAIDAEVVNSGQPLIIYTDAKVSYQDWFGYSDYYNNGYIYDYEFYYYSNGGVPIKDRDRAVTSADKVNGIQELAPVMGYSVYSYKNSNSNYGYGYGNDTSYGDYVPLLHTVDRADSSNEIIKVVGGKYDGKNITKTSLLMELTFEIQAFPTRVFNASGKTADGVDVVDGQVATNADHTADTGSRWGTKKVTVSRLVGIKKLSETKPAEP